MAGKKGTVYVFDHPLIQHKTALMRDKNTNTKEFRALAKEIAMLMGFEATRNLPLKEVAIETPICETTVQMLAGEDIAIVPVLRSGLAFAEGIIELIPNAKIGHIGLYRDPESHMPVEYYCKLPADIEKRQIFLIDPMLATGMSAVEAINCIKKEGAKDIVLISLIASPEGIDAVQEAHPDVDIYAAAKDKGLTEYAFITPGLGDVGDRLYGTK